MVDGTHCAVNTLTGHLSCHEAVEQVSEGKTDIVLTPARGSAARSDSIRFSCSLNQSNSSLSVLGEAPVLSSENIFL